MILRKSVLSVVLVVLLAVGFALAATGNIDKKEYVCMMQDMVLGKPGIPIEFAGKTYYGCCEMCKEKIKKQPQKYTKAIDPVSGQSVDKAVSFIYGLEGSAYYFSSEENRKAFATEPQKYLKK